MGRYLVFVLAFQLLIPWAAYLPVYAQEAPAAQTSAPNLDLSSTDRTVAASDVLPTGQATINLAGIARTISPTDMLTAAEMVAVRQVVNTGNQYLQLNDLGAAIGGGLHLQYYATNGLGNLVIPEGVRATQNAAILQSLNLTGNLTNSGTFNILSSNAAITSATVNAANIYNNVGATISSTLANLNLNAVNNIVNAGTIMSAGNLSMTAGGSITNSAIVQAMSNLTAQAASMVNTGTMLAQQGNINALTAQMTNSGLMQSLAGNVNIHNLLGSQLSVDGILGNISAAHQVNLSTLSTIKDVDGNVLSKGLISLTGNSLSGQELNFTSGEGIVNVNADRLAGPVAVSAGVAFIGAKQGDLTLSRMDLTGDPIYYAMAGNLDLSGLFSGGSTFSTSGGDFVALASGDITATTAPGDALIDTTPNTDFGSIAMYAGVDFNVTGGASPITCSDCAPLYEITGTSSSGGSIDLPTVSLKTSHSGSMFATGIHLEARDDGSQTTGNITIGNLENRGRTTESTNNVGFFALNTLIQADGNIFTGGIDTSGMQGAPGVNGAYGGNGGGVSIISTNGNVEITGSLNAVGGGGGGSYNASPNGGYGGIVRIFATEGTISIDGELNTFGGGGGGGSNHGGVGGEGGGITLVSNQIDINGTVNASGGGGGGTNNNVNQGGAAGNITMFSSGGITINGPVLAAGGGDGGDTNGGGGGSFGGGGGGAAGTTSSGSGGGSFGQGGASGAGGGGYFGGGSGGTTGGFYTLGGGGGGNTGGEGGLTENVQTGENGSFGFGGNAAGFGNAGEDAGVRGGGAINLSGSSVTVTETIDSYFGFSTSPFAAYSIYAGEGGSVAVSTPTALLTDANYESGTADHIAYLGSSSFTIGGSGSAGSINAGNGIYINRTNVGTDVASGTTGAASNSVTITENSAPKVIDDGDPVTAAEWLAVVQEVGGGQTVTLDASGNASAGTVNIALNNYPGGGFTDFIVPAGLTFSIDLPILFASGSITLNSSVTANIPSLNTAFVSLIADSLNISNGVNLTASGSAFGLLLYVNDLANNGTIDGRTYLELHQLQSLTITGDGSLIASDGGTLSIYPMNYSTAELTITGNQIFDFDTGTVSIYSARFTLADNANLTISGTSPSLVINASEISLGANSTIEVLDPSTNIVIQGGSVSFTLPTGSEANILTAGGTITFENFGFSPLNFVKSSPVGIATLNLNGGDSFINGNPLTAQAGCVFCTDSVITLDNNGVISTIENDCGIIPYPLTSLDLVNDPNAVAAIIELQSYGILGGTLIESGGIATGGNVIIAPTNLAASLTAYNIPDNVTVTMQGFTDSDFVNIDITGTSTTSQAILGGTHEFTGGGSVGQIEITSDQTGPAFFIEATGLLISDGNLLVAAPSITNEGSISSLSNGIISISTNDFINEAANSIVNAGGFGTVNIYPFTSVDITVGGSTHSGVSLDVTTTDMENIIARTLQIGNTSSTSSLTLAGNVDVAAGFDLTGARNYNLRLLSANTYDSATYSINLGFNQLYIEAGGNASTNVITGTNTTIEVIALGVLTINDQIEAVDPNSAFSINGNIRLSGSPVMFNLDPGENIVAGNFDGVVTLEPSSSMNIYFFTATQGGVDFDISADNLEHIKANTLNIGNFTTSSSITLADNVELGFANSFSQLNFYTNGSYDYDTFTFNADSRSVSIYSLGTITAGAMTNGGSTLVMDAIGTVTIEGELSDFQEVTLAGSPVILNGNEINAFTSVTLRPTSIMDVNVAGSTVSGSTFDITADDLDNISTSLLTIGDGFNASSMTVVNTLDISGPLLDPGNFDLRLISNGDFTSQGQVIVVGRDIFDNSGSLTITTYGNAEVGQISSPSDVGAQVFITAGGTLDITDDIDVSGGTNSGRIELRGSPVSFTGNTLNAGQFGFVALAPTSDTVVAIGDATGTAAPFDVSASDLAAITTGTLQIGDIYHTLILNVEDDIDLSGLYSLVLVSSTDIDRNGISITLGSNSLGLSTNGGLTNLATGNLDISYLFEGNSTWRQSTNGIPDSFSIMTGGTSSAIVTNGWIDMGVDGGDINIVAGSNFDYTANGAVISFISGTSSTGGAVELGAVNFTTSGSNNDIIIEGRGDFIEGTGYVSIGAASALGAEGDVTITADNGVNVGSPSTSRVTKNFTVLADGSINTNGSIVAENIFLDAIDNDGGVFVSYNLYALDTIEISSHGQGNISLFSSLGSSYIEAPTISIATSTDPLTSITVDQNVQIVTPVGAGGSLTITTPTLTNDGLIAALGGGATLTIQAPTGSDLTITAFDGGRLVADPLSGIIIISSADGEVNVTQKEISGPLTGSADTAFYLTSQTGLLTISNITANQDEISITSGSDMQILSGSTIVAENSVAIATTAANASLLISADSIESISGNVLISNFSYVKNDGSITADNDLTIENTLSDSPDLIVTGAGTLAAPTISLESSTGAVIATQDNMQGTVNASSASTLVLSILNPSSFTPGTMTSATYAGASLVSGFSNLYAAANSPITFGDAVFATTTGSFGTFTVNSGVLTVTGTGNMVILIRDTDAGITSIDGIATGGGSLYFDTTAAGGLTFTGNLDTRGGAGTSGGYLVLGSTSTVSTEAIHTGAVTDSGFNELSGGAVRISANGNIDINEYIDTRGEELGSGGNVMLISETGDITFSVSMIENGNITAVGGSGPFAEGTGGNILIGAGDAVILNSTIDSSAELSGTNGSRGSAGWVHISASSISASVSDPNYGSIRANGGNDFGAGDGGSVTLIAGSISVANYISSTGLGSGNGGDITIRAGDNINIAVADATGGRSSVDAINGGNIVIQSNTGAITVTSYIDSSNSVYDQLDGGGRAGMVFVVAPTSIAISSIRAEGRSRLPNESSSIPGFGGNIYIESSGTIQASFLSSSAQSIVATRSANSGYAGRIDVIAGSDVNADTFKSTGSLDGGNGGDVNITSLTGDVTTSFIFTTAIGHNLHSTEVYGDGGNISISSAGSVTINSFIDTGGSADSGNGGSVLIQAEDDITSHSYLAANAVNGNGGNIELTSTEGKIDFDFSLDSAARGSGNGGYIVLNAQTGIEATIVASAGGETSGHGGDIIMTNQGSGAIQLQTLDSTSEHNGLRGSSNAGNISLTSNGNLAILGNIDAYADGVSGDAGRVELSFNSAAGAFVIDGDAGSITNGVIGAINAYASGSGNGGSVAIANQGGDLDITLNATIDTSSVSGNYGNINFNFAPSGSDITVNAASDVTVTGNEFGYLIGPVNASGPSIDISLTSSGFALELAELTATNGSISASVDNGALEVYTNGTLQATEGNITLQHNDTANGIIFLNANATLTATSTGSAGNIYISIGTPTLVEGSAPANIVVDEQNGGQVYFGTNSITANAPDNFANADGADVVFDTASLDPTAIVLDGNVTLNATGSGGPILLTSLDLTDPTVTELIISLQGSMELGGTLIVDGGGIATGGNVIIAPENLAAALTAYNIPDNVTITMQDFTVSDVLTIDITAGSTTSQAILSGTHEYTGASPSAGVLTITSDQTGPVFLVNSTALLTSNGSLTVNVNGDITLSGDVSATTALAISTTANDGAISIDHDISAGSIAMTAHGSGSIQGVSGTLTANSLTFTSGSGAIVNIVSSTASLAANTTGVVNVNNSGSTPLTIGLSSANSFTVSNDHDITVSGTITATNALSLTTTANDGSISINADTSGTGITISTQGNGNVSVAAGEDLHATNGTLQISTHNVTFDGTLTADNGDIMILANNNQDVVIGGTSGTLNITNAVLSAINGSNFLVGYGTSMTVVDDIDISGVNFSSLYLQPNGSYSAQGQTVTLGDKALNVQILSSGTIDTGAVTGTSGSSASFNSNLALTVSGTLTVGNSIQLSTSSGNIDVAANMSASNISVSAGLETLIGASITGNSVIVSGLTGISRTGNFTITSTGTISLSSSNHGDIGSSGTPILTDAGNLSVTTNPNSTPFGNAYISNAGNVNLTGLLVRGDFYLTTTGAGADITTNSAPSTLASSNGVLSLTANGSITAGMNLVGQTIVLQTSSGSDGNITLNRNVTGTNGVTITADGTGTVSNAVGRSISSTNSPIVITSNGVNFSGTVDAGTSGSVTLRPNGSQTVSVGTGGGGDFDVSDTTMSKITAGTLIVGSTLQSGSLTITSSLDVSGTGAGTFNLQFDTGGNYTASGQTITLGTKSLTVNALGTLNTGGVAGSTASVSFTSGNGLTVSSALALSGNGSIGLTATGAATITLNNDLTTASGGQVTITTGSGDVSQQSSPARTVTSGTLTLNSTGGSFGTSFSDTIDTSVSNLIVNSTDEVYIFNTGALTIGPSGATSTADTLDIQNNQAITIDGDITTTTLTSLYTTSGAINVNADLTSETVAINTSAGTVTTAVSTHIEGTGSIGAVGIFGDDIDLNGTITANATAFTGVVLGANTGIDIEFAGTGSVGVFNVSVANLSGITANWLTINGGDDMTIVDDFDFGTTSFTTITFNPGGGYVGTGQELSLGSNQELHVGASGSDLYTGTITGSSSSYVAFSLGGSNDHLIIDGAVTAGQVVFSNSSGGDVIISANVGDPNGITHISALNAGSNNITRTGNFTLSGANVQLQSDNGDIGSISTPLLTSADILQINSTTGSTYISETDDVTLTGNAGGEVQLTSSSGQVTIGWLGFGLTTDGGSATIIANGDIHVTEDITVNEGNLILQDMNTSSGAITIDQDLTLSATTTGSTLGRVYIFIGTSLPSGTNTTAPANVVVNNSNGGLTYFGTNNITASAPNNTINTNGSLVIFDTGSLPDSAISLGGNVTINGTSQPAGGGPVFSLDFTDPTLTALIISLQGTDEIGGDLIVNEQGVATGGNAIIGYNMLSDTLTSANIPTGVTITFDDFNLSNAINIDITSGSYSNVAIIGGTLEFDGGGSPSAGLISINSDQASASGNPAFVLTNTGSLLSDGSLSLSASGRMLLNGTLTAATDLTLATTANNGNISITGTVTATNSATLSTNGTGTVTGTVNTPVLNFASTMGSLGTSGTRFVTMADSLSINTGGDAYINNTSTGALSLGATTARNFELTNNDQVVLSSFQASQSAYILVNDNDGGITLNGNFSAPNWMTFVADGSGDIVQNAGSIRSSSIYLASGTGDIGSSANPIQTNAFYTTFITSGGEVHINSSNSVRIHNPSSGSTVDITSNGEILVAQPITSSGSVTFHGAGSIILQADITATSFVSLFGNGHGNILNNGGSIITPTVTTSTGTGSIGTDIAPIDTTADNITSTNINDAHFSTSSTPTNFNVTSGYVALTLNINGDLGSSGTPFNTSVNQLTLNIIGAAYVNASGSLVLGNSTVRDTVQISANGNLTVNDLVTTTGSISLTAQSGILTINPGSTVQANEGNVTLTNNSASGTIFVGNGALVKGFTVSNESFGNVTMTVGSSIGTAGTAPGNVTENIVEDGQIIIGNNGFTSNNSGNTLDALDRTITIDAGATGSIVLDGNVTISADPPIAQVTAPSSIANILPLLSVTSAPINTSNAPLGSTSVNVQPVTTLDTTLITRPLNVNFDQYQLINDSSTPAVEPETSSEPVYKPIAYATPATAPDVATITNAAQLSQADFGSCMVRHAGADVSYNNNGSVNLNSGEILIHNSQRTFVQAGHYSISIDPGSVALITREGNVVKVRALHEAHMNDIVITAADQQIKLSVGQEVMFAASSTHLQVAAQKDSLGRRHVVNADLSNGHVMSRSEFSHMCLMEQSHVLTKLIQSKSPADKQLAAKLIKTAACLMTVTGAHGAFTGK